MSRRGSSSRMRPPGELRVNYDPRHQRGDVTLGNIFAWRDFPESQVSAVEQADDSGAEEPPTNDTQWQAECGRRARQYAEQPETR